jgi:hypothetical protein
MPVHLKDRMLSNAPAAPCRFLTHVARTSLLPRLRPWTFERGFTQSDLGNLDFACVEKQIQPPRTDCRIADTEHDLIPARLVRSPCVRPHTPRAGRIRRHTVFHTHERLIVLESDRQRRRRLRAAPHDADNPVLEASVDCPLFHPDGHSCEIDDRRLVLSGQARHPMLMGSPGELPHLRRGRFILVDEVDT